MTEQTKLVVIFNHRFEENIPTIHQLYANRFEHTMLMPFFKGEHPDVVSVYDSSHRFHGFVSQGYDSYRTDDATHYLFVADDLFLNPRLTRTSAATELGLSSNSGYIKELNDLARVPLLWEHLVPAVESFHGSKGTKYERELPSPAEVQRLLSRHSHVTTKLKARSIRGFDGKLPVRALRHRYMRRATRYFLRKSRRQLPYPLFWGYSDCFAVPSAAMDTFVHYCGVFAAMDLFVEVAIPTALALACENIRTEQDISLRCVELWDHESQEDLVTRYGGDLDRLSQEFPEDWLYVHPVKLSRWRKG